MMRTEVFTNRFTRYSREIKSSISSSVSVSRIPIPLQECIVIPPICVAAIPVEAVTARAILCSRQYEIKRFTRNVFPLPAAPVRRIFFPIVRSVKAWSWFTLGVYEKSEKSQEKVYFLDGFFTNPFWWKNWIRGKEWSIAPASSSMSVWCASGSFFNIATNLRR